MSLILDYDVLIIGFEIIYHLSSICISLQRYAAINGLEIFGLAKSILTRPWLTEWSGAVEFCVRSLIETRAFTYA